MAAFVRNKLMMMMMMIVNKDSHTKMYNLPSALSSLFLNWLTVSANNTTLSGKLFHMLAVA